MEFTVIDANVIRSHCATIERDKTDGGGGGGKDDDTDRLIAKFKDVECLDLSCLNILHITNLCLVSPVNLTTLKLSVNRIDKICNLDSFTNLVELDLSHNRIKHIENLQGLVKLQRLILNHNPLTTVQNLDIQRDSLEMLDIGYCKISTFKFIMYLKKFTNLVSLTVEGNPARIEPADSERKFIISMIQTLLVCNNKTVMADEKKEAFETYSELIKVLEKNDRKWKLMAEKEKLRLDLMEGRKDAFLDQIPEDEDVDFNVTIFQNATVEQVLKENSRYGIHNAYRVYAEDFRRLVGEITTAAETSRVNRKSLVDAFHDKLRRLIDETVHESRKCVSEFVEYRKRLKRDRFDGGGGDDKRQELDGPEVQISSPQESAAAEDESKSLSQQEAAIYKRFDERSRVLWLTLMGHEDELSRKTTEMIVELRDVLEKQIVEFKQLVNNRFCLLQRQQNVFLQFVLEYAVSSSQSGDLNNRSCRISQFTNDISQCMESQALQMERAELYITKSASEWLDKVFNDLNSAEIQRNRQKISEIATFLRFQNETLKHSLF